MIKYREHSPLTPTMEVKKTKMCIKGFSYPAAPKRWVWHLDRTSTSTGEGNGNPLQCSCLENPRDRGAWWAAVHGVAMRWTRLSDFTFTFHFYALEKEMATHSRVLAWRIPGTGEPGGLLSLGSQSWTRLLLAVQAYSWRLKQSCMFISRQKKSVMCCNQNIFLLY